MKVQLLNTPPWLTSLTVYPNPRTEVIVKDKQEWTSQVATGQAWN
jgi:hypothetical protein